MKLKDLSIADLFALRNYYLDAFCDKKDEVIRIAVDTELISRLDNLYNTIIENETRNQTINP